MRSLKKLIWFGVATFLFLRLSGVTQINQDGDNANFGQNIVAKAFDPYTQTFYVATGANNVNYTIAKAGGADTLFQPLTPEGNHFNGGDHFIPINHSDDRINNGLFGVICGVDSPP